MVSRHLSQSSLASNLPNGGFQDEEEEWMDSPHVVGPSIHRPKDSRSRHKYNILSRLFFCWVDPLFWLGLHRSLNQSDLYAHPSEADSKKLLNKFNKYWAAEQQRKRRGQKARLLVAICKCLSWRLLVQAVLQVTEVALLVSQSIILGYLSEYFSFEEPTPEQTRDAYLFAAGLVLLALLVVVIHGHAFLLGKHMGMLARIAATAAIYQKVLTLSQVTISRISIGHVVNLASNDVQRLDLTFDFLHYIWIVPIHLVVFTYLLYAEVGWIAFLATAFVLLQIPLQICFARLFAHLRFKSARVTDQRVRVMNEVISGIRVIKMYAWEHAFRKVVSKLRRKESLIIFQGALIRACNYAYFTVTIATVMFMLFTTYVGTGGQLTPKKILTTFSLLITLRLTSIHFLTLSLLGINEGRVASARIAKFLELNDDMSQAVEGRVYFNPSAEHKHSSESVGHEKTHTESQTVTTTLNDDGNLSGKGYTPAVPPATPPATPLSDEPPCVKVEGISASWSYESKKMVLNNISMEVNKASAVLAVVGPVGAGKELKPMDGHMEVKGRVLYASQEAWVFSGTLRENILFGRPYKPDWYNTVMEACALDKDVAQLVDGDLTLVGERGVTLSGGQKARVNLARVLYHDADIYLLDDPLSAVDAGVARHLFEKCIRGLLADRLVVLVTHQVQFALQADKILALKDGKVEAYGSQSELISKGVNPANLLGLMKEKEERDEFLCKGDDDEDEDEENNRNESAATNLTPPTTPTTRMVPSILKQRKKPQLLQDNLFTIGPEPDPFDTASLYSAPSLLSLHSTIEGGSSRHEEERNEHFTNAPVGEEKVHGTLSMATYYHFFRAGGNFLVLIIVLVVFLMGEASIVVADWWLLDWAGCSTTNVSRIGNGTWHSTCLLSTNQRIGIYGGATATTILINFARTISCYFLCVNASRVLHNRMFAAVLRAPMLFFDTNPIGRVLNRFSKDVGFLDDLLPYTFTEYLLLLLRFLAIMVTAAVSNYWVLIPAVLVITVFLAFRWYFLKTSREIKRLEAIARSPFYSHISSTLQGLPTIRTFGNQSVALDHFHKYQNEHTQGWYLYIVTTRWFGMRIDTISAIFLAAVAFLSVPLASQLNAGLVGLGLTYTVSLAGRLQYCVRQSAEVDNIVSTVCQSAEVENIVSTVRLGLTYTVSLAGMFQYCVRQSAEVDNIMISAERIMGYSNLESEAPLETLPPHEKPPPAWPERGEIVLDDVSFRYSVDLPLVLKSLSFHIKPSEKVGIVGRTGAGKSSLLAVLYRMAEPFGAIMIDGVNTKEIGLHDLRQKMSIIPQDPVLFSGTMRYNLDPFSDFSDAELWNVLEQVQLKPVVQQLEGQLHGQITEGGANFSVGQRQLVCLARALLRKNKILVLDEATANVDIKTDAIIQETIRDKFSECTVLTIAHRLNTVMDSDRILVVSRGQLKEFDSPYHLLQNPRSQLRRMVERTGPSASRKLQQMALDAHMRRRKLEQQVNSETTRPLSLPDINIF